MKKIKAEFYQRHRGIMSPYNMKREWCWISNELDNARIDELRNLGNRILDLPMRSMSPLSLLNLLELRIDSLKSDEIDKIMRALK